MGASNYLARRSTAEAEERASREDALRHAAATIGAFVAAGLLPLAAYLLPIPTDSRFIAAVALTAATLFSVGAARSFVTGLSPFRSGLEMLLVGALAAVAAYLIGAFASLFTDGNSSSSGLRSFSSSVRSGQMQESARCRKACWRSRSLP